MRGASQRPGIRSTSIRENAPERRKTSALISGDRASPCASVTVPSAPTMRIAGTAERPNVRPDAARLIEHARAAGRTLDEGALRRELQVVFGPRG